MRKKKYENFIAKLMMTKDIIDAAELEKHIRNVVGYDKSSLEKEYFRINELIENQYDQAAARQGSSGSPPDICSIYCPISSLITA